MKTVEIAQDEVLSAFEERLEIVRSKILTQVQSMALRRFAPELLPNKPSTAIIQIPEVFKSGEIKAGETVVIRDKDGQICKFTAMHDEHLVKAAIESVEIDENGLFITVKALEEIETLSVYFSNSTLFCQLICTESAVFVGGKQVGYKAPRIRKEFIPHQISPYFLLYQCSLCPLQYNFIDLHFYQKLPIGNHRIRLQIGSELNKIEGDIKLNCVPIIGIFEECTGYAESVIATKYDIFDVINLNCREGDSDREINKLNAVINNNVLELAGAQDMLLSAKLRCISPPISPDFIKIDSFGEGKKLAFYLNQERVDYQYEALAALAKKHLFQDWATIINEIMKLYSRFQIDSAVELTVGVWEGQAWSQVCPKYFVTLTINNATAIGYAIAWASTFQKLCDINHLCDVQILTPNGAFLIEDRCEW